MEASARALAAPASQFQRLHVERSVDGRLTHNIQLRWRIRGPLDADDLARALALLADRHEALRTGLQSTRHGAVQVIVPACVVPLAQLDLARVGRRRRWRALGRQAQRELVRPFALAEPPLLRASLVRLATHEHVLLLTASHAIWDGWSSGVALRDLALAYTVVHAGCASPPRPALQFADSVAALRRPVASVMDYWQRHLEHYTPLVSLTPGRDRRAPVAYLPGSLAFRAAPAHVLVRLEATARRRGATAGIALVAALLVLLWLAAPREWLHVAMNDVNRDEPRVRELIGPFLGFFVLAVRLGPESTLATALDRARDAVLGAYAHRADLDQQLPSAASRWSDPRWPVVHDAWINYFPAVQGFAEPRVGVRAADVQMQPLSVHGAAERRWNDGALGFTLTQSGTGAVDGTAVYNAAVVDDRRARCLASAYSHILRTMAVQVQQSLTLLRTQVSLLERRVELM